MAITLLTNIDIIQPAYNPFTLVMSSTTSTNTGYNYIVDLYSGTTYIRRLKVPAIPTSNYFGFCEISSICSDYISDKPMNINWRSFKSNTEQYASFNVKIGEEYKYSWTFTDNQYCSITGFVGKLGFTGSTAHQYIVGDYIFIAQTSGFTNAGYEGVHKVIAVPDSKYIIVDYPYIYYSGSAEGGLSSYQDNRKIIYTGLTNTAITVGNFAIQHENFPSYQASAYTVSSTASKFLTELPNDYSVRTTNNGYLNIIVGTPATVVKKLIVEVENDASYEMTSSTVTANSIVLTPAFSKTVNAAYGAEIIKDTTTAYSIYYVNSGGTQVSEKKRFVINTICKPEENVELLFEDLYGNMIPFNFHFITSESTDISREFIKVSLVYSLSNGKYNYDTKSPSKKQYSIKSQKKYSVISEYLTDEEAVFFEQLLLSKQVYFNTKNESFTTSSAADLSEYIPVNIVDTSFITKTTLKDALIQYTISFELSNNRPLNI